MLFNEEGAITNHPLYYVQDDVEPPLLTLASMVYA